MEATYDLTNPWNALRILQAQAKTRFSNSGEPYMIESVKQNEENKEANKYIMTTFIASPGKNQSFAWPQVALSVLFCLIGVVGFFAALYTFRHNRHLRSIWSSWFLIQILFLNALMLFSLPMSIVELFEWNDSKVLEISRKISRFLFFYNFFVSAFFFAIIAFGEVASIKTSLRKKMYDRSSLQVPSLFGWVVGLGLTIPVLFASESYPAYLGFLICFSVFIFLFGGATGFFLLIVEVFKNDVKIKDDEIDQEKSAEEIKKKLRIKRALTRVISINLFFFYISWFVFLAVLLIQNEKTTILLNFKDFSFLENIAVYMLYCWTSVASLIFLVFMWRATRKNAKENIDLSIQVVATVVANKQ